MRGRLRPFTLHAAVGLAALLAVRLALEVAPHQPTALFDNRPDLNFPQYSDVARFGDSRFLHPPDWASRPVAFEMWFAYRGAADAVVDAVSGKMISFRVRKVVVYAGWFLIWLVMIAWLSGFYVQQAYGPPAAASTFAARLVVTVALVYVYCLGATVPMYVPYDLVSAAGELALFTLIFAFWDRPSWSKLATLALGCLVGVFIKETLVMGVVALWLVHLGNRQRPHWPATALLLIAAVVAAWQAQELYAQHVVRADYLWERTFSYVRGIWISNIVYLLGRSGSPGGVRTLVFFVLPLLVVLTPFYRSGLATGKDRILRLTIFFFLASLLFVGNPRECRIMLEFVLLAYVCYPLARLGISPQTTDNRRTDIRL